MQLTAGERLGPYEIIAPIGKGGMGEVYRAWDPRVEREVAIKVCTGAFSERFQREAKVIASLNHANICTLFDVGPNYLVMELVEGPTLAERIKDGAIPLEEAWAIAQQIGGALEHAHEKLIVHRDIKPGNVKIKPDGVVKVLDFGLAKIDVPPAAQSDDSPTLSMSMTEAGTILGTAAYMAPEQARGKPVDKRADIWAFGAVLYEMLTARRLFRGEDVAEFQPDLGLVPSKVRPLLARCLEKDPARRLRDIGDMGMLVDSTTEAPREGKLPWVWPRVAAMLAIVLGFSTWGWWTATRPVERPLMRFTDDLGAEISLASNNGPAVAISPDGLRLAYISRDSDGKTHLSVRLIGSSKSTVLAGAEEASAPFFSPDSRWIAYFADQKLKKISADGGAAVSLCDVPNLRGGAWGDDDTILFAASPRTPLSRVASSGGTPQPATEFDKQKGEATHRFPQVLPGAEAFLFTSSPDNNTYEAATVEVQSVKTGQRKTLVQGYFGRYLPSGYLIYFRGSTLLAAPMDAKRLVLTGPAAPVLEDISSLGGGFADLTFNPSGTVVYAAGSTPSQQSLFWQGVSGNLERLPAESGAYSIPRPSPDDTRIAVLVSQSSGTNLSVYEWATHRMTQVTFLRAVSTFPTWTADSKHLLFPIDSQELSGPGIYWMRADGVGQPQRLLEGQNLAPYSVSPNGTRLAYFRRIPDYGIWTASLDLADPERPKAGKPELFLASKFDVRLPAFSPDGQWMAYVSAESGSVQLYVRPFPGAPTGSGKWQVSTAGANGTPYWSRNRNELFYQAPDGRIWVAGYTAKGDSFAADQPRLWSAKASLVSVNQIALMPDGKRFVAVMPTSATERQTHVTFLLNFSDKLRRLTRETK